MMRQRQILMISLGAAVVSATFFLFSRQTKAATMKPPSNPPPPQPKSPIAPPFYGESKRVSLSIPPGWRRVKQSEVNALPELASRAVGLRNTPGFTSMEYGTLSPFTASDGNEYATWVEQHYHEPGGSAKPWGLHHGVTLLARAR